MIGEWGDREKRDGVNNQIPSTNHQIITNASMTEILR